MPAVLMLSFLNLDKVIKSWSSSPFKPKKLKARLHWKLDQRSGFPDKSGVRLKWDTRYIYIWKRIFTICICVYTIYICVYIYIIWFQLPDAVWGDCRPSLMQFQRAFSRAGYPRVQRILSDARHCSVPGSGCSNLEIVIFLGANFAPTLSWGTTVRGSKKERSSLRIVLLIHRSGWLERGRGERGFRKNYPGEALSVGPEASDRRFGFLAHTSGSRPDAPRPWSNSRRTRESASDSETAEKKIYNFLPNPRGFENYLFIHFIQRE